MPTVHADTPARLLACLPPHLPAVPGVFCCRGDDRLFATARKIITALIARIHTVDWTTAIVQHPTGRAVQVQAMPVVGSRLHVWLSQTGMCAIQPQAFLQPSVVFAYLRLAQADCGFMEHWC